MSVVAPRRVIKVKKLSEEEQDIKRLEFLAAEEEAEYAAREKERQEHRAAEEAYILTQRQNATRNNNWSKKPTKEANAIGVTTEEEMKRALLLCGASEDFASKEAERRSYSHKYYKIYRTPKRLNCIECKIKSLVDLEFERLDKALEEDLRAVFAANPDLKERAYLCLAPTIRK
jgi:hypothetical protein